MADKKDVATVEKPADKGVDPAVAAKVLQENARQRMEACVAEVNSALQKHGCTLVVNQTIEDGRIVARVTIGPR